MSKGWYGQSPEHALAAKGIKLKSKGLGLYSRGFQPTPELKALFQEHGRAREKLLMERKSKEKEIWMKYLGDEEERNRQLKIIKDEFDEDDLELNQKFGPKLKEAFEEARAMQSELISKGLGGCSSHSEPEDSCPACNYEIHKQIHIQFHQEPPFDREHIAQVARDVHAEEEAEENEHEGLVAKSSFRRQKRMRQRETDSPEESLEELMEKRRKQFPFDDE